MDGSVYDVTVILMIVFLMDGSVLYDVMAVWILMYVMSKCMAVCDLMVVLMIFYMSVWMIMYIMCL